MAILWMKRMKRPIIEPSLLWTVRLLGEFHRSVEADGASAEAEE